MNQQEACEFAKKYLEDLLAFFEVNVDVEVSVSEDVVELIGESGRITFSSFGANDPVRLETTSESEDFHIPHPEHIQQPMIQAVVDELNGQGTSPSTGETAARTNRVMDQLLADWRMLRIG